MPHTDTPARQAQGGLESQSDAAKSEAAKSLPYACSCCGFWNWDMFEDWVIGERNKAKELKGIV